MSHDKVRATRLLQEMRDNLTPTERRRAEQAEEFADVQMNILLAGFGDTK